MVKSGRIAWVWGCPDFRHQGALLVQAPGAAYHFRPVPRPDRFPGGFLCRPALLKKWKNLPKELSKL